MGADNVHPATNLGVSKHKGHYKDTHQKDPHFRETARTSASDRWPSKSSARMSASRSGRIVFCLKMLTIGASIVSSVMVPCS